MRRITALALAAAAAAALAAGCATKQTTTEQVAAANVSAPKVEPVKVQEATPQERAAIRVDLAAGYYERGQFDVALEVLKEAEQLDPNRARIYDIYGLVYTMLGENAKADASFRRALSLAPNDSDIRANWGAFLCVTGREREAIPEFDAVIRDPLYKTPEVPLVNAGKCILKLGDKAKADEYFRRALAVSPGNPFASYQLALLSYDESRVQEARSWLRPAIQIANPRPEALYLGMCIERKLGDKQAEASYVAQLRNRYPDSAETRQISGGNC